MGKIAAAGIRVKKWISQHGIALNVSPDLAAFEHIVPCGIPDRPVTSVQQHLASLQDVDSSNMGYILRRRTESDDSGLGSVRDCASDSAQSAMYAENGECRHLMHRFAGAVVQAFLENFEVGVAETVHELC
jgi:hypothetical protein